MKRGKLIGIVCVIATFVVLLSASCQTAQPSKVFNLTFSIDSPVGSPIDTVNQAWVNWLDSESGGRIKVTILPSGQAAKGRDQYDAARTGRVDIADQVNLLVKGRWPLQEVTTLPFLFDTPGAGASGLTMWALYQKYPELQAEHEEVKVINFHAVNPSQINTIDKPVHTMEDLVGVQLVVTTLPDTLQTLGATPVMAAIGEDYDMLAKRVADGIEANYQGLVVFGLAPLLNYSTEVCLSAANFTTIMNLDTWNSLPSDLQELFEGENAFRYARLHGYITDEGEKMFKGTLNEQYTASGHPEVYVLPEAEKAKWEAAVMPIREQWIQTATPIVGEDKARAILNDAINFAGQYAYKGVDQEAQDFLKKWGSAGP